jgi:hypothetical protein
MIPKQLSGKPRFLPPRESKEPKPVLTYTNANDTDWQRANGSMPVSLTIHRSFFKSSTFTLTMFSCHALQYNNTYICIFLYIFLRRPISKVNIYMKRGFLLCCTTPCNTLRIHPIFGCMVSYDTKIMFRVNRPKLQGFVKKSIKQK